MNPSRDSRAPLPRALPAPLCKEPRDRSQARHDTQAPPGETALPPHMFVPPSCSPSRSLPAPDHASLTERRQKMSPRANESAHGPLPAQKPPATPHYPCRNTSATCPFSKHARHSFRPSDLKEILRPVFEEPAHPTDWNARRRPGGASHPLRRREQYKNQPAAAQLNERDCEMSCSTQATPPARFWRRPGRTAVPDGLPL